MIDFKLALDFYSSEYSVSYFLEFKRIKVLNSNGWNFLDQ